MTSSTLRYELGLDLSLGLPSLVVPTICPGCPSPLELHEGPWAPPCPGQPPALEPLLGCDKIGTKLVTTQKRPLWSEKWAHLIFLAKLELAYILGKFVNLQPRERERDHELSIIN